MLKTLTLCLGAVLFVVLGWFFVSPLFIDKAVDESLPVAGFTRPSPEAVAAMTPAEKADAMQQLMSKAAAQPDQMVDDEMMESVVPTLVKRGKFRDADAVHRGSGDALIYQLADGSLLLRLENFRATNGPALVVYLAEHADPDSPEQVEASFVSLGELKGNVGNQNYAIPPGTELSSINSVVIWCELFGVLFSPAALVEG